MSKALKRVIAEQQAAIEQPCNPHPKAPHGFLRNASHTEDRYVCECEYWDPYEAGYQAGAEAAMKRENEPDETATLTGAMATPMAMAQAYENGWNAAKSQTVTCRLTDDQVGRVWFRLAIPGITENQARLIIREAEKMMRGEIQ